MLAVAASVLVIVVVLGAGLILVYTKSGQGSSAAPAASESAIPSPTPKRSLAPPSTSPSECLIGRWREMSYASRAEIFGTSVMLKGSGAILSFGPDGTFTHVLKKISYKGKARGDSYEVIHNGKLTMRYEADADTIYYSDPRTSGTSTWKVNGRVQLSQAMGALLDPERYSCTGNGLRIYGNGATVLERILGPGTDT